MKKLSDKQLVFARKLFNELADYMGDEPRMLEKLDILYKFFNQALVYGDDKAWNIAIKELAKETKE